MERRLAAILAADVAGYSLLMNTDEEATYRAWRTARVEVIDPLIGERQGRIVKHTGDGFLAEFPTVLAAVECAVEIQREMGRRNAEVEGDRRFEFRIGINLGDIIVDDEDIHGDGVNIAARLESIAEAGGVCISEDVYHQVNNKPGFDFQDLGERTVKNIPTPIRVYRANRGDPSPQPTVSNPIANITEQRGSPFDAMFDGATRLDPRLTARLVGRDPELALLDEAYREVEAGQGNIVLIRGEPGIGKSCLAGCFTERVKAVGALVVYGQCHETLGSPPYWPWLQILKGLETTADSATESSANIFERLAATDTARRGGTYSSFAGDAGAEQFLLFNQIVSVLSGYATRLPLVLVLDDLHWADKSSLLLLTYLCGKLSDRSILVIGTYREIEITRKHPLFTALGDIGRQATLRRIALKGLSELEVRGFIQDTVSQTLPADILTSVYEKTEGNPLFVSEIARILQLEGGNQASGQLAVEIPEGIKEAIGRRLNELSDECNELLALAAVVGRRFELRVLASLQPGSDKIGLLQILEEADRRGIVEESGDRQVGFRFRHVLIRDILYDELSLAKKILMHRKVADVLVRLRGEGGDFSLGEIARHYYQALQGGKADEAMEYAILAAEHADSLSAFDEAKAYYELALDVCSVDEGRYGARKAELYLNMTICMHHSGALTRQTRDGYNRCMDEARKHRHYAVFAQAACRKVYATRAHTHVKEGLAGIDEALSYLNEDDLTLRAEVLAQRAAALSYCNRRREAEQVAFQAVSVAAESGDKAAHSTALCIALLALRGRPEKLTERIRLGEQALIMARDTSDEPLSMDPLEWLILSYQELGDMSRVRQLIAQLETVGGHCALFKSRYFAVGAGACLALFDGDWQRAEAIIEEAAELGAGKLDGGAEGVYGAQMFLLNRELGRLPMVQVALRRLIEEGHPMWPPGLLATYTELGLREQARPLFDDLAADDFARVAKDELYLTCLVYLTEACMELEDSARASALYQRLVPYSGQMVSHPTAVCYGPADLYLGMLASQMNNLAEAESLFARAAALCAGSAPNMWRAHIEFRHAQVLKRHNFSGGKALFREHLSRAREFAQALGMVNLLAKIARLTVTAPSNDPDTEHGLTPRELEVLNLVAQGKSNKLIAAELHRSLATVATHVRAILNKTHTANRTEAAAFAMEQNMFQGEPSRANSDKHSSQM